MESKQEALHEFIFTHLEEVFSKTRNYVVTTVSENCNDNTIKIVIRKLTSTKYDYGVFKKKYIDDLLQIIENGTGKKYEFINPNETTSSEVIVLKLVLQDSSKKEQDTLSHEDYYKHHIHTSIRRKFLYAIALFLRRTGVEHWRNTTLKANLETTKPLSTDIVEEIIFCAEHYDALDCASYYVPIDVENLYRKIQTVSRADIKDKVIETLNKAFNMNNCSTDSDTPQNDERNEITQLNRKISELQRDKNILEADARKLREKLHDAEIKAVNKNQDQDHISDVVEHVRRLHQIGKQVVEVERTEVAYPRQVTTKVKFGKFK